MKDNTFGDTEIEFPVTVHFRIICHAEADVSLRVKEAAQSLRLEEHLQDGNTSGGGRYRSYNLSLEVDSLERMQKIDRTFRAVDGVKMVL
ncbi:MAG: DUF493 domain-containing protein [Verrucomicrobia bacterium]|nr:DUF493 domain-containing protein [Verrucomicrobiota bacterium]MCH8510406.1 DUF493 domain-containing protein [Kiritimatiellia bacterium]